MYRPTNLLLSLLIAVLVGLINSPLIDASDTSSDFTCNCDNCDAKKVMGIEENDRDEEDFDADGDRTICARDRDLDDRTFPSICHMLCHNKCTRYRVWIYRVQREKKYIASAFRTDFYKLRDGPC